MYVTIFYFSCKHNNYFKIHSLLLNSSVFQASHQTFLVFYTVSSSVTQFLSYVVIDNIKISGYITKYILIKKHP